MRRYVPWLLLFLCLGTWAVAQVPYKTPPREVVEILDAPPIPQALLSPRGDWLLLVEYQPMPSIRDLAQPLLRLAGMRITPQTNSRQRLRFYTGLVLVHLPDGARRRVELPDGIRMGFPEWSPDGTRIAFTRWTEPGLELWVVDVDRAEARALTPPVVSAVLTDGFEWLPGGRGLLVWQVPDDRGPAPQRPRVPIGPDVWETAGKQAKVRTYQDLLRDRYDADLFAYYATARLVRLDLTSGQSQVIGPPDLYSSVAPSPDGRYFLVQRLRRPFSYSVPYYRFARSIEVWDRDGNKVATVADLPVAEEVPIGGVPVGPRSVQWRARKAATLVWVEALDGGDPERDVPQRDRWMTWHAPFTGEPQEIGRFAHRFRDVAWLDDGERALVTEYDWRRRWVTTRLWDLKRPDRHPRVLFDHSIHERYQHPGYPLTRVTVAGEEVVVTDRNRIYLVGSGATPEGDRPFLDRLDLHNGRKERLFRSPPDEYEWILGFVTKSRRYVVTRRESKQDPPNFYVRDLRRHRRWALTDFPDPAPQLTGVEKRIIRYQREDGVELSGLLYLPPGYQPGQRLPLVFWAYPIEFTDPRVASQIRVSPNRFTFYRGATHLFFLTQGYAVLDRAQMPVVGDPKTANDTFVEQIVANARAAIRALDEMGIIDPDRVGVGGHSYGAFMTANLLAHSDLFRAGIARSGAYNRTLTPFGFQNERRTLWEAPQLYFKISPFMHAHRINEPILLIHGEIDNNSGTFPIQSRRLFHALKGLGGTARLVMLPYESHGYRARESVLHVIAEMFEWFDRYVKHASPRTGLSGQ